MGIYLGMTFKSPQTMAQFGLWCFLIGFNTLIPQNACETVKTWLNWSAKFPSKLCLVQDKRIQPWDRATSWSIDLQIVATRSGFRLLLLVSNPQWIARKLKGNHFNPQIQEIPEDSQNPIPGCPESLGSGSNLTNEPNGWSLDWNYIL